MIRVIFSEGERAFLARMRVARMATADSGGQPHVIPIVFAFDDRSFYTPLDDKPKHVGPRELKRVRNLAANPQIAIVVDHYDEDWAHLGWVMVRGKAEVVDSGEAHAAGLRLLQQKYPQYQAMPLEGRPLIVVTPLRVTSWGALR